MKTKIRFQAYIPKSLGKPLYDYFKNDHRLKNLKNKEEFIRQLTTIRNFQNKSCLRMSYI